MPKPDVFVLGVITADAPDLRRDIVIAMARRLQSLHLTRRLARSLDVTRKRLVAEVSVMIDDGVALRWIGPRRIAWDDPRTHLVLDLDEDALITLIASLRATSERGHTHSDLVDAAHLIHRIAAQLPRSTLTRLRSIGNFAGQSWPLPEDGTAPTTARNLVVQAIRDHRKLGMIYTDQAENRSDRVVWPLRLTNHNVSFIAWCEIRNDFRTFNLSTTAAAVVLDDQIPISHAALLARWRRRGLAQRV